LEEQPCGVGVAVGVDWVGGGEDTDTVGDTEAWVCVGMRDELAEALVPLRLPGAEPPGDACGAEPSPQPAALSARAVTSPSDLMDRIIDYP
jgi:hypothetical protein